MKSCVNGAHVVLARLDEQLGELRFDVMIAESRVEAARSLGFWERRQALENLKRARARAARLAEKIFQLRQLELFSPRNAQ